MTTEPSAPVDGAPEAAENADYQRSEAAASLACPTCAMTVEPDNDGDLFCPCCGWDPIRDAGPIPCEAHPAQAASVVRDLDPWAPDAPWPPTVYEGPLPAWASTHHDAGQDDR